MDTNLIESGGVPYLKTFSHGSDFIGGYLQPAYSGFILSVYSAVGVPKILMISTSTSTAVSPTSSGCPSMYSAITQPADQTSIELTYFVLPNNNSGAL